MNQTLLLVDDDTAILDTLGRYLRDEGFEVLMETRGRSAVAICRDRRPELVILDLMLPDVEHLEVLETLRALNVPVVLLTGHGDVATAVEAMQLGAESFLTKPIELEHLRAVIGRVVEKNRLLRENDRLRRGGTGDQGLAALGVSAPMRQIAEEIETLAASERITVLITGENGTGKGWVARMLHSLSPRGRRPFVEVNSDGVSAASMCTRLFGHENGASPETGERREGLITEAEQGTLFLDEVSEMEPEVQLRLLKVLETRTFRRLGGTDQIPTDVRMIAATNQSLPERIKEGKFREDLYYRLNVATIHLPPLRKRAADDRLSLLHQILAQLRREIPGRADRIEDEALELLLGYAWPGNIREMRNAVERALIFAGDATEIRRAHLPAELKNRSRRSTGVGFLPHSLEAVEAHHIELMLLHHRGNRTRAAKDLGIARTTLINKIRKYRLDL